MAAVYKAYQPSDDAMAYAHAHLRVVVYPGVKPSNILIDPGGNCLLTGFGVAKIVEGTAQFTPTGGIVGTPAYIPPEQIHRRNHDPTHLTQ